MARTRGSPKANSDADARASVGFRRRSTDLFEVAVAAEAVLEAGRAGDAVLDQRAAAVVPFLNQRLAHGQAVAPDRRAPIRAHATTR